MYLNNIDQNRQVSIEKKNDLIASKDSELGHTDMVKIQIDVGNNEPIKMKPYRTLFKTEKFLTRQSMKC